jgi:hypothetical protein
MAKARRKTRGKASGPKDNRVYELEVSLLSGPVTEEFARSNPAVSRTIRIRGDQTLKCLHDAIFEAFDRDEEHMYEFEVGGKRPMDPRAKRYVLPMALESPFEEETAGVVTGTTVGRLGLEVREVLYYWFDFGDDWWHRIKVAAILEEAPSGEYPQVTARVGDSPPQYINWDEQDEESDEPDQGQDDLEVQEE